MCTPLVSVAKGIELNSSILNEKYYCVVILCFDEMCSYYMYLPSCRNVWPVMVFEALEQIGRT